MVSATHVRAPVLCFQQACETGFQLNCQRPEPLASSSKAGATNVKIQFKIQFMRTPIDRKIKELHEEWSPNE